MEARNEERISSFADHVHFCVGRWGLCPASHHNRQHSLRLRLR